MSVHPAVRLIVPAALFALLVAAPRRPAGDEAAADPAPLLGQEAQPGADVPITELYHELAKPGARVTVVEFSDFGCPYCGRFERETFPALRREFVETGKVRWRFVPFVLGMFPNGSEAFQAAACVAEQGEDAFWRMHDLLFERQNAWKDSRSPDALFRNLAVRSGADGSAFDSCYLSPGAEDHAAAANALAHRGGVRSTPSFFVNGTLVQGALPLEEFRTLLERATR